MNNEDIVREVMKLQTILNRADRYFDHQTKMNAELHMSTPLYSPLASAVKQAASNAEHLVMRLQDLEEKTDAAI